ncbi:MAG: DNA polymerase III subunit beta [Verrucomicrobiota bacterium]|nr:DNA polymerase III subunit beta [Verrucomicrobiota bacterium]
MKISIAKEDLVYGLQMVQNVVGARSTLPILSNVLVVAGDKKLELRATDLEVSVHVSVTASIEREGATSLPAKRLFGLVRELESTEVEIEVNDKEVATIQAGAAKYKIHGIGADEYPKEAKFKESGKIKIAQKTFREMLRKTAYAVSTDESRHVLNGIHLVVEEEKITLVATDGRRLALVEEEIEGGTKAEIIVPNKAVGELQRLMQGEGEIEIGIGKTHAEFTIPQERGEEVRLHSKLVEGNYPNYNQVIPKQAESKQRITLVKEEINHALRRADQITSDKANSVKLKFGANKLEITANTPEVGSGRESLAINYEGPEIEVAFNPTYLMDPLKVLEGEEIYLEITDSLSPGVIKSNTPFLYVIMPMRTN